MISKEQKKKLEKELEEKDLLALHADLTMQLKKYGYISTLSNKPEDKTKE